MNRYFWIFCISLILVSCGNSDYKGKAYGDWMYSEKVIGSEVDGTLSNGLVLSLPVIPGEEIDKSRGVVKTPRGFEWCVGRSDTGKDRIYFAVLNDKGERINLPGADFYFHFTNKEDVELLSFEDVQFHRTEKCFIFGNTGGKKLIELFERGVEMNVDVWSWSNYLVSYVCTIPSSTGFTDGYSYIDKAVKGYSHK